MTQFEVMINLAGIKTKEGEDFVKVVKKVLVRADWNRIPECDIYLENGSICSVSMFSVRYSARYSAGMSRVMSDNRTYNFNQAGTGTFWSEFRRAMTEIAGLYEF